MSRKPLNQPKLLDISASNHHPTRRNKTRIKLNNKQYRSNRRRKQHDPINNKICAHVAQTTYAHTKPSNPHLIGRTGVGTKKKTVTDETLQTWKHKLSLWWEIACVQLPHDIETDKVLSITRQTLTDVLTALETATTVNLESIHIPTMNKNTDMSMGIPPTLWSKVV